MYLNTFICQTEQPESQLKCHNNLQWNYSFHKQFGPPLYTKRFAVDHKYQIVGCYSQISQSKQRSTYRSHKVKIVIWVSNQK